MTDLAGMADKLYADSPATDDGHDATSTGAPGGNEMYPTRANVLDADLYGDLPKPNEMYPIENAMRGTFQARLNERFDVLGQTKAGAIAVHRGVVATGREAQLQPPLLETIYNRLTDAEIAAAKGTAGDVEAQKRTWAETARREIRGIYGDDAESLIQRASKFIAANPRLAQLLAVGGISEHPEIAKGLVEHVRRVNFR